jgi:hypothetical protein
MRSDEGLQEYETEDRKKEELTKQNSSSIILIKAVT